MLRFIANLVIAAVWLLIFDKIGWITFVAEMDPWLTLALTAVLTWGIMTLAGKAYGMFILGTCGLGCTVLPVYLFCIGWATLYATAYITHWYNINVNFWGWGLLMSLFFGLARIPDLNVRTTTTTSVRRVES